MGQELFQRNIYEKRLRLTAEDLENQQRYDSGKRRLLNRALHGCGVVYGMEVSPMPDGRGVTVSPGLALDEEGRELFIPEERQVALHLEQTPAFPNTDPWYVCVAYQERRCGEGLVLKEDGTHQSVCNRMEEDVDVFFRRESADGICLAQFILLPGQDGKPARIAALESIRPRVARCSREPPHEPASGVLRVHCGKQARIGESFYSEEIPHGLGPGDVRVTVAAEGTLGRRRCQISGAFDLFQAGFDCAVALFPDSGTFFIKIRLRSQAPACGYVQLRWYASKSGEACRYAEPAFETACAPPCQDAGQQAPPQILEAPPAPEPPGAPAAPRLEPGVAVLDCGQSVQFQVLGLPEQHRQSLRFFAEEGEIDFAGRFTAPAHPAVVTVWAKWSECANCKCSAFAIVRERR